MQISSENTYTTPVLIQGSNGFDVLIAGTFNATVTVQMSKDLQQWHDIQAETEATLKTARPATAWFVRAGVKTGDYTSGTVEVEVR